MEIMHSNNSTKLDEKIYIPWKEEKKEGWVTRGIYRTREQTKQNKTTIEYIPTHMFINC